MSTTFGTAASAQELAPSSWASGILATAKRAWVAYIDLAHRAGGDRRTLGDERAPAQGYWPHTLRDHGGRTGVHARQPLVAARQAHQGRALAPADARIARGASSPRARFGRAARGVRAALCCNCVPDPFRHGINIAIVAARQGIVCAGAEAGWPPSDVRSASAKPTVPATEEPRSWPPAEIFCKRRQQR